MEKVSGIKHESDNCQRKMVTVSVDIIVPRYLKLDYVESCVNSAMRNVKAAMPSWEIHAATITDKFICK